MISAEFQRESTAPRERRPPGTASAISDMSQGGDLAALAKRVFRRSLDMEHTAQLPEDVDAEVNLLGLNRKNEPSWPVFHLDYGLTLQDRFVSLQKWEG